MRFPPDGCDVLIERGLISDEQMRRALEYQREQHTNKLLGQILLDLTAVATTDLGNARIAMAQVRADNMDSLVGSAMIRENDPAKATARAVRDAINRKLEFVIRGAVA